MTAVVVLCIAGFALQSSLWVQQRATRNAATIDVGWAVLVASGAILAAAIGSGDGMRRAIVALLVVAWASRLIVYLVRDRVLHAAREDGRYRSLRDEWGHVANRRFLALYLAQVPIAALFVVPVSVAMQGGPPDAWTVAGIAVWVVAAAGEMIADRQLASFRANPRNRGHVCRSGLWRYSRHPNYFFEWTHWFAYVLIGHGHLLTWIGPVVMLLFLFRITGIPYTERQAIRSRGVAYTEYQRMTSVFFPWPPREVAQ